MKYILVAATLAVAAASAFAADVGVSVSIGQPGFYGRLDIGDYPQPVVIYRRPIAVRQVPVGRAPIYLRVPPGHAKHWNKHCHEYNACDERVLFVQDNWYSREYVPRFQARQHDRKDGRHDERQDDQRGDNKNDRHDNRGDKQNQGRGR